MTDYIGWNSINPTNGTLRQTGDAFFSGAINLGVNIFDMDGRNENSFITIGNDVTINATQLDMTDNVFNGTLEITEPAKLTVNLPAAWEMAGTMNLIGAFVAGPEPVLLDGAAPVIISGFVEADGHSQIDAVVTIASTGQIDFPNVGGGSRGLVLGMGSHTIAGGMVTGDGALGAVSGATLGGFGTISADVDFDSTSQLLANNGTLTISGDIQHAGVLGTASSTGVLNLTQPLAPGTVDELKLSGGTIQGANINHAGTTSGSGTINVTSFSTSGTTTPGLSAGTLQFTGNFSQTTGTIVIEIGGTTPGTEYDQIDVGGQLSLSGVLDVLLIGGFAPSAGDSFDIFDFTTLTGTFNTINLPTIGGGLTWDTSDLYTTGVLSVMTGSPADLDGDGDVDGVDLGLFFGNFTGPNQGPPANPQADLDGDGDVDGVDLGQAFAEFTGPLTPANIPEPSSLALLVLGGLVACRRRS